MFMSIIYGFMKEDLPAFFVNTGWDKSRCVDWRIPIRRYVGGDSYSTFQGSISERDFDCFLEKNFRI